MKVIGHYDKKMLPLLYAQRDEIQAGFCVIVVLQANGLATMDSGIKWQSRLLLLDRDELMTSTVSFTKFRMARC